jgi:branched-chain amino acid transport system substrate-binding protein
MTHNQGESMRLTRYGLAALALCGSAMAQDVVRIAHVAPITGGSAHVGKDNENGARMAIEDLNARGFTINGKKVTFVLVAEDDAADPKQGTAVAQKLVDAKVNGVIGHVNSGTTVPASKIYFDAGIPQISAGATAPQYTRQGFNTAFRVVADDIKAGQIMGRYAVERLKAQRIAIIDDRTAYGQGAAEEFVKGAKARNGAVQIVAKEYTSNTATDFTAILTTIKAKKPDLIFFGGMDAVGGPMLRQIRALGISTRFMGGDGLCTDQLAKLAGDAVGEGSTFCSEAGGVTGEQEIGMNDFLQRYRKRYNADVQIYAPYVYDALMAMATAMQNAKSADPAKYLPALQKVRYPGVSGLIAFDARGDIQNPAMTLFTYKGGKKAKLEVIR